MFVTFQFRKFRSPISSLKKMKTNVYKNIKLYFYLLSCMGMKIGLSF